MKIKTIILIVLMGLGLAGCASNATLNASVRSVSYLNPDINNNPAPIVITIYQLTSPQAFNRATFYSLYNDSSNTLGSTLIGRDSYEIRPNQKTEIKTILSPTTNYLGVVAAYRNTSIAKWRQTVVVPQHSGNVSVNITLGTQGVSVSQVSKKYICVGTHCLL